MTKEIGQLEELVHKRTYRTGEVTQLRRIADTLDDIVAMMTRQKYRYNCSGISSTTTKYVLSIPLI